MSKETESQKIGTLGETIVAMQVKQSGIWIARHLTEDYGVDLELEHSGTEVNGCFVKIQIKTKRRVKFSNGQIKLSIKRSFIKYCIECRVPILLVNVCADTSKSWYIWMQKWIIENDVSNILETDSSLKSLTVSIPLDSQLVDGLRNDIISIADWMNNTQLMISLQDLARLSLKLYDDQLAKLLFAYLEKIGAQGESKYVSILIDQALELGNRFRATPEGNRVADLIYAYVREHGQNITANNIIKLIVRDDVYSRVGITVLGLLYDFHSQHTKSLQLIGKFEATGDDLMSYYCAIRERYLGMKSPTWLNQKDLEYRGWQPNFRDDFIMNKWANRGDSVVFDYLQKII